MSQYVAWLSTMPDAEAATFATGLLDFGEPGHEAFARGLQGPRRLVYLQAWPRDSRVVPRIVAEAALAPVDRKTPPGEVAMLLSLAYSSFPDSAAGALAALEKRVDPSLRPLVAPALERVRFRAAVP